MRIRKIIFARCGWRQHGRFQKSAINFELQFRGDVPPAASKSRRQFLRAQCRPAQATNARALGQTARFSPDKTVRAENFSARMYLIFFLRQKISIKSVAEKPRTACCLRCR